MRRESSGPVLSAMFVDYDNIYLSLKRKSEEAAKRFSKDAIAWIREIESGRLITPTNGPFAEKPRRMVMNRCYGNPVPRRNTSDNSTDMNSFPFVRHHFLRSGFEVVDCPPLTAQLKNSSDIRMVMDVRDFLTHDTYFDEFVILSGDADFTPVLHRLRAHARRTIIFANDYTATPYTAICDGEVRESNLIRLLLEGSIEGDGQPPSLSASEIDATRNQIIAEVATQVRSAGQPVPLESLAERAVRLLGHERTAGSGWAGAGSFRDLLHEHLPDDIRLTDDPPYLAYLARLAPAAPARTAQAQARPALSAPTAPAGPGYGLGSPAARQPAQQRAPIPAAGSAQAPAPAPAQPRARAPMLETQPVSRHLDTAAAPAPAYGSQPAQRPAPPQAPPQTLAQPHAPAPSVSRSQTGGTPPQAPPQRQGSAPVAAGSNAAHGLQQSISRIQEACQAPPLSPPEYRSLFECMAHEINQHGLQGTQTLANIQSLAQDNGLQLQRDDVRFVLDVVSEPDPWFEQGASANLFAGRFRNFVVARCRSQGLSLSVDELDLIEAWFAGGQPPAPQTRQRPGTPEPAPHRQQSGETWWSNEGSSEQGQDRYAEPRNQNRLMPPAEATMLSQPLSDDEFPRIVRTRQRG